MRKAIWSFLLAVMVVAVPLSASPRDVTSYAETYGVSVAEAGRRLGLQQAIGELDAALAAEESASFAGLWVEHKPEFRVIVRFTDPAATARLASRLAGGPLEGLVETRSARVALADLERQQQTLRAVGDKAGAKFNSEIDVRTNRMNVFTLDPVELRAKVGNALPKGVQLERVARLFQPQALIGGDGLTSCTAGFAVRNSSGELGISTAGHCSNYQYYNSTLLPFRTGKSSQYTDAQWHSTCGIVDVVNQVKTPDGPRTITATRSRTYQAAGHYVCKYGMESGYSCGTIEGKHYDPGTGYEGTFVRVNDKVNLGGDSGAPWFQEGVALGLHHGEASDGEAIYMPINYISDIGVTVLTYNPGSCTVAPVASFTFSGSFGGVDFDASASYDPNGTIVSYAWDFGDGTYETNTTPYTSHFFDMWTPVYTVWLTVTDNEGRTSSTSRNVRVCDGPGQPQCPR